MEGDGLVAELAKRLSGRVVISAQINDSDIVGKDIESLSALVISFFEGSSGVRILDRSVLEKVLDSWKEEKAPLQIEVSAPKDFNPIAKEIEADYRIRNTDVERTSAGVDDFAYHFNDRFRRLRGVLEERSGSIGLIGSMEKLPQYANGREVGIIGMVYDKIVTKKGNIMATIEDETGSVKVLFYKPYRSAKRESVDLFESASRIVPDEVIGVRGRVSSPFVIANALISPDIPTRSRKRTEDNVAIAFTSDIHVGSKLFLEKHFGKFLEWINGNVDARRDLAERIKYLVISGDLVDGIGVYPNQERELSISDIYKQYSVLFDLLSDIPEYIEIFVLAGNHDALPLAEPQPELGEEIIGDFKKENIHLVSNPGYITLHGIKVLAYHGASLDSIIQSIPGCSYSRPESAMIEVLRKRHISPIYGDNPIMPSKRDALVIDEVPDILHMGHVHRNGYAEYHGTQVINSGTWQAKTSYQVKFGHMPTPGVLPVWDAKNGEMLSIDFNTLGA